MGPRCSDGTLLREIRLSRQECSEEKLRDITPQNCEIAENFPGKILLDHYANRTTTKHPTPEESDYFYDDYIDYNQYNETVVQNILQKINESMPYNQHFRL